MVLAATDPVAAWGGSLLLGELGLQATVITGPATDNEAGRASVRGRVADAAVLNARTQSDALADAVFDALDVGHRTASPQLAFAVGAPA